MPTLVAPAKLTLSLRIAGVREDGYHLIDAEMVTLDFGDIVEVDPEGDALVVIDEGVESAGAEDDLVARALRLAGRRAGVVLHKRVPQGAGLGGGSADAAAILRWAGWTDEVAAARLGADVPFCLRGGRARVRGIGERVDQLPFEDIAVTLLTPPIHCSTPEVYRKWDDLGSPVGENDNDLEPAAMVVAPELALWRDRFAEATGQRPRLSGSGSTWWVRGSHPGPGHVVTRTIRPTP